MMPWHLWPWYTWAWTTEHVGKIGCKDSGKGLGHGKKRGVWLSQAFSFQSGSFSSRAARSLGAKAT